MGKTWWIVGIIIVVLVLLLLVLRLPEDDWIKDERGVWIKHGQPSEIPSYVIEQQEAIACALNLYQQKKEENLFFSSQCLGTCDRYSVDIVHVPRTSEDNKEENQCSDYREGRTSKFIELNSLGEIVKIV